MKHGFAVIAIPETGLFVRDGQLVTGHNTSMAVNKLLVHGKREDAVIHAIKCEREWSLKEPDGKPWHFHVMPVQVEERN